MPLSGIILLTVFVISLPICFLRPFYGIALWMVVAFLNPQSSVTYWWAANSFPWAMAVAIPTMAGALVFGRGSLASLKSREVFLLVILWIWFTVTTLVSVNTGMFQHHVADTWYRWGFVSKVMLMAVVTIVIVDSFAKLRVLLIVIGCCFGYFVTKGLPFIIITGGAYRLYGPPQSMIGDNNDFGLALNMTLPIYFFMAQTEEKVWLKRVFGGLFLITIPAIFMTYSRGALIGLCAVMALMFVRLKQRWLLIPVLLFGGVLALVFAPDAWKSRMDPNSGIDASGLSRINAWTYSWRLASDYPIFGGGFDTFTQELFDRYAPNPGDLHGPHSVYFGLLAEHGFPGLFLYLTLVVSAFLTARKIIARAKLYGDHTVVSYANIFRFSLVGFLVSGAFLGRAYFDYFFDIIGCLAILRRVAPQRWTATEATEEVETEESMEGEIAWGPQG